MKNLLKETLIALENNGKKIPDIKWLGSPTHTVTWEEFIKIADVDYDSGYGSQNVAKDLIIVGDGWWLERQEYDGCEWWEYKEYPIKPSENLELKALTIDQANDLGIGRFIGWESLGNINGV